MSKQNKKASGEPNGRFTLFHAAGVFAGLFSGMSAGSWCVQRTESVLLGIALGVVVFVIALFMAMYLTLGIVLLGLKCSEFMWGSHADRFDDV